MVMVFDFSVWVRSIFGAIAILRLEERINDLDYFKELATDISVYTILDLVPVFIILYIHHTNFRTTP